MHVIHVAIVHATFQAPPDRIYRVLKGVAEGHGGELEWAEVVERSADTLLCDFWTELKLPFGRRIRFRTQETVELDPPSALHYRHRSGPSRGLAETLTIRAVTPDTTRVIYRAVIPSPWRWFGRLFALFGKPVAHIFMYAHFEELRRSVERPGLSRGGSPTSVSGGAWTRRDRQRGLRNSPCPTRFHHRPSRRYQ
jgi:hypothetical protein